MPDMRVALAQLDARLGDVEASAERARQALGKAEAGGAELVVFPELYLSGYALRDVLGDTSRTADDVAKLTKTEGPAAVVGFHEPGHNSAAYVEAGRVVHIHRKLYLVDHAPFHEDELFVPGSQ